MSVHPLIIPTCVPRDASNLFECIGMVEKFSRRIHIDVNDAIFARPMTWPYESPGIFDDVDPQTLSRVQTSVHLMVEDPYEIGISLAHAGTNAIIAHVETLLTVSHAQSFPTAWRSAGTQVVGLAILLDTPLERLDPYIPYFDFVVIMSIASIGKQGARFDERAIERIQELKQKYPHLTVAVDGGINEQTIKRVVQAGAQILYVGSAIACNADPVGAYQRLKKLVS